MSSPPAQTHPPPVDDFLATVRTSGKPPLLTTFWRRFWSVKRVVCYGRVCYKWVCYERGLL